MALIIDKERTGRRIQILMKIRNVTVKDISTALSLGSVQGVYQWIAGKTAPSLDNLYALSDLLKVPVDMLICGNREESPWRNASPMTMRLFRYYIEFLSLEAA